MGRNQIGLTVTLSQRIKDGYAVHAPGPRFYCDNNVHRLGRSLRMLGYDTLFFGSGPDQELRKLRDQSNRILLSRDSDFRGEANTLVVTSDDYLQQLKTVVRAFELDTVTYRYTLCLDCNRPIRKAAYVDHVEQVPDWLARENEPLWRCPDCGRLFWAGSHLERMNERFERLFG